MAARRRRLKEETTSVRSSGLDLPGRFVENTRARKLIVIEGCDFDTFQLDGKQINAIFQLRPTPDIEPAEIEKLTKRLMHAGAAQVIVRRVRPDAGMAAPEELLLAAKGNTPREIILSLSPEDLVPFVSESLSKAGL